ncbi:transcriptional regulator with GAF, ATPase, and Fis domain [Psychromicrobium silvestre]|uniref:Transcriptional regulator with GAF, ATPase, and Fis domain n=1 Tax=Psychromicrobium silvestre TaxID=1645614 RepID=A0A7Y9LS40_9MICC|nr:GAF domain-containing protein [Psychromicrobium silvestre]NYE94568.1 transcriptional regulator with GAF, ATPase, and Fis domain [Psychromicrobium silvestre]
MAVFGRSTDRARTSSRFVSWAAIVAKTLSVAAPVAATILFFWARDSPAFFWWAAGILLLSLVLQLTSFAWERRLAARTLVNSNALNTYISQMAAAVAEMPGQSGAERVGTLNELARYAVTALVNVFHDAKDVRAIAYSLGPANDRLEVFRYAGVRQPSGTFIGQDAGRGDKALDFVFNSNSSYLFIPDLKKEKPEDYGGSGNGYRTFISVRINSSTDVHGMLTLDAADVGDLTEDDAHVIEMFANILAIAFAETARASPDNSADSR